MLKRKPYPRDSALISRTMMRNVIGHSLYQLFVMMYLIFLGDELFGIPSGRNANIADAPTQHFTIVFNAFVWMQVGSQRR